MSSFIVKKVAVLGAGVMGAQIAAHCVNAKVPVILFDLPAKEGDKNGIAVKAIEGLKKLSPAPLGHNDLAALIQPANYEQHMELLRECDVVIEAIAERMDWKHDLYRKVTPFIAPHAIFATNTSGLSITKLGDGFEGELKSRFCGVHFFNPPRYMHLAELIPTASTKPEILDRLETFLTTTLGKGVVRAKDTPNFVGNRVGIFGILATFVEAQKFGLSVDVVDDLTGDKLGRAKSATFRTADVVGLDTMGHVIKTMQDNLASDPWFPHFATPAPLAKLIAAGALGQKTGVGFYKKVGKDILRLDFASGNYVAGGGKADETVARILKKKDTAERIKLLRESTNAQAQFVWAIMRDTWHYIAVHLADIADSAREVDFAMRFGFGSKQGPFELWQAAGWKQVAEWIKEDIAIGKALSTAPLPAWVFDGRDGVHTPQGSWSPAKNAYVPRAALPVYQRQVFRTPLLGETTVDPKTAGKTVFENEEARLWTLEERGLSEVLILSIRSKLNTIGAGLIEAMNQAVELAESGAYQGLVLWSPSALDGGAFSAGANLEAMLPTFMKGGAKAIEPEVKKLQDAMLRWRYANVPTVAAVSGLALGGGCELQLYCHKRVAHLESYIGLVEVGVGLVPAGGGLAYGARRATEERAAAPEAYLLQFLTKYFMNAGTAQVAKSAIEARKMGYLLDTDVIVFNPYELLYVAVREAKALHDAGYRPPMKTSFPVAGRPGIATVMAQLVGMRDGGFISPHDFHLGKTIAEVMCGGDVEAGSMVTEEYLMTLERKAFCGLLTHPKTQERIMGMLQTGKPVRN